MIGDLCLVEWDDAMMEGGWKTHRDIMEDESATASARTVGWLFARNERFLTLVQSVSDGIAGNLIHIPVGMIRQVYKIDITPAAKPPKKDWTKAESYS